MGRGPGPADGLTVRELAPGEDHLALPALLELRPHLETPEAAAVAVRLQREDGYRLVAAFVEGEDDAAGVAGFRSMSRLHTGLQLYVDDLVTRASVRGRGAASALLDWLDAEGRRLGCRELHLDSGVVPERQAAHRRYFGHGMRITSYHFAKPLPREGSGP